MQPAAAGSFQSLVFVKFLGASDWITHLLSLMTENALIEKRISVARRVGGSSNHDLLQEQKGILGCGGKNFFHAGGRYPFHRFLAIQKPPERGRLSMLG